MEWHNTDKKDDDIDISNEMHGGNIFDNHVIFIDFGPVSIETKKIFKIDNEMSECIQDCPNCRNYSCMFGAMF